MKSLLFALVFFICNVTTAGATSPCLPHDSLFEEAALVAYGTFDRVLQKKPVLRCEDADEVKATGSSQCKTTIKEKPFSYDPYRFQFRIDRIFKINLQKVADAYKVQGKDEAKPHIQLSSIIIEAGNQLNGQTGIIFLSGGKNEFNDLQISEECGFFSNDKSADAVKTILEKWPTPVIVE